MSAPSQVLGGVADPAWSPGRLPRVGELTADLSPLPAENFGTVAALIHTFSPVRGLTPWRAALRDVENFPKPVNVTCSPAWSAPVTTSRTASTASPASFFVMPVFWATASTTSCLVTASPPDRGSSEPRDPNSPRVAQQHLTRQYLAQPCRVQPLSHFQLPRDFAALFRCARSSLARKSGCRRTPILASASAPPSSRSMTHSAWRTTSPFPEGRHGLGESAARGDDILHQAHELTRAVTGPRSDSRCRIPSFHRG